MGANFPLVNVLIAGAKINLLLNIFSKQVS